MGPQTSDQLICTPFSASQGDRQGIGADEHNRPAGNASLPGQYQAVSGRADARLASMSHRDICRIEPLLMYDASQSFAHCLSVQHFKLCFLRWRSEQDVSERRPSDPTHGADSYARQNAYLQPESHCRSA